MNCFDWQNRASDYLDGTLEEIERAEADEHLDRCQQCVSHYRHYKILVDTIASQPRSSIPVPIRRAPMTAPLPRRGFSPRGRFQWSRIPWHLRAPLEGLSLILVILAMVSAGPRIRRFLERRMEINLNEFNQSFLDFSRISAEKAVSDSPTAVPGSTPAPIPAKNNPAISDGVGATDGTPGEEENRAQVGKSSDAGTGEEAGPDRKIHVGNSEVWRFILKTDDPAAIKARIVRLLASLRIPQSTPGIKGIEVPGGIEFDLLVSPTVIPEVKNRLQEMAPPAPTEFAKTPASETFTWYKSRSKQPIPPHTSRLVIWISQI